MEDIIYGTPLKHDADSDSGVRDGSRAVALVAAFVEMVTFILKNKEWEKRKI